MTETTPEAREAAIAKVLPILVRNTPPVGRTCGQIAAEIVAALSPPAISEAVEAEREAKRLRRALETVVSDCQLAIDCLGNSPPQFDATKRAFGIIRDRARTSISEVVG